MSDIPAPEDVVAEEPPRCWQGPHKASTRHRISPYAGREPLTPEHRRALHNGVPFWIDTCGNHEHADAVQRAGKQVARTVALDAEVVMRKVKE